MTQGSVLGTILADDAVLGVFCTGRGLCPKCLRDKFVGCFGQVAVGKVDLWDTSFEEWQNWLPDSTSEGKVEEDEELKDSNMYRIESEDNTDHDGDVMMMMMMMMKKKTGSCLGLRTIATMTMTTATIYCFQS